MDITTATLADLDIVRDGDVTTVTVLPYSDNPVAIRLNRRELLALIAQLANA